MSGKTAAPWEIPYSEPLDEPKTWPILQKEQSERIAKLMKERFLTLAEHGVSFTASSGELVKATAGITVTLPSAAVNATVGVLANNHEVKVGAGAAVIYGDFITGVTPITLVGYQHVILQADGTNWFIVGGEPKREAKWSARTSRVLGTEYTPSTTRPMLVSIDVSMTPSPGFGKSVVIYVGGEPIKELFVGGQTSPESGYRLGGEFEVPAGQAWKVSDTTGSGGISGLFSSYLGK